MSSSALSQLTTGLQSTPFLQGNVVSWQWMQFFIKLNQLIGAPVGSDVPEHSNSSGTFGQIATDDTYLYWYTGSQWLRVAGSAF
jgi:hypothetical protein